MRWYVLLAFFSVAILAASCVQTEKVICNKPYIRVGGVCCLDKNENNICDKDEAPSKECPELDCNACPPKIITENETVEITKYVCSDGKTVVSDPESCDEAMKGPEPEFNPVITNEDDQEVIKKVTMRPACRGGINAVEIYFEIASAADDVIIEAKDSEKGTWKELYKYSTPVTKKYLYGVFCDKCTQNADFFIEPEKKYLFRIKFDYRGNTIDDIFYSNEHIIDDTDDGEFATKLC